MSVMHGDHPHENEYDAITCAVLSEPEGLFEALDPPEVGQGIVLTNGLRATVMAVEGDIVVIRTQLWQIVTMRRVNP